MISKEQHKVLVKKWSKVGRGIYQKWTRMHRLQFFLKYVDNFKGKNVLEMGCNAGLYGYEISKVAKSYTGVDRGDYYIAQANVTKKVMGMDNSSFYNESVRDYIKRLNEGKRSKPNALFASFVLYHLSEKETTRLKEYVLPLCDTVIIQTRTKKRTPWRKYNPLKLNKISNVEKYLKEAGFQCKSKMGKDKKYGITIAKRIANVSDQGERGGSRTSPSEGATGQGTQDIEA